MGEGLKSNHTILGIHILGNEGDTDTRGFIKPIKNNNVSGAHVHTRIPPQFKSGNVRNTKMLELKVGSNCWICEGWSEVRFEFKPGFSDNNPTCDMY